jgi:two-component system, LytTR family, sensor kinase
MNRFLFSNLLKYRLERHLALFVFIVIAFSYILYYGARFYSYSTALGITLINSMFFFGYAYITLFYLIPRFLLRRKLWEFIVIFSLTGIMLSAIKLIFSGEIYYAAVSFEKIDPGHLNYLKSLLINTKDMTFIVALFCVGKFSKDYIYLDRQRKMLEAENMEARQKLLQSQLDPDFLYNTINNLYALSLLDPAKTAAYAGRLQKVLGYIAGQSRNNFATLDEEVALVKNYIALEKLRYGKRLKVKISVKGNTLNWQLPPMILFFMAENCVKHGSKPDTGAPWLQISIDASPEVLVLSAVNSKPLSGNGNRNLDGKGLLNLKKRLEILYPEHGYLLQVEDNDLIYRIHLQFKNTSYDPGRSIYR